MNRREFLSTAGASLVAPLAIQRATALGQTPSTSFPSPGGDGWVSLFNGRNLDGWYTFLGRSGKNNDPGYVRVEQGMIHFYGNDIKGNPEPGFLATTQEYSDYHFRVEFKWGTTRYAPRSLAKRDSGIYFHVTGPDRIWPTAPQLQIEETDLGDILALNGVRFTTAGRTVNAAGVNPPWPNPPKANAINHGGPDQMRNWAKSGDFEKLDDWNLLEIMTRDDSAAFLVNGRVVNSLFNMQVPALPAPANGTPPPAPAATDKLVKLNRGRIALEIEYAEIWFRNVAIRPLSGTD